MVYVPKGFAHGFQTLTDNAEVFIKCPNFITQATPVGSAGMILLLKLNGLPNQ